MMKKGCVYKNVARLQSVDVEYSMLITVTAMPAVQQE
jgi:hypothetical protein